MSGTPSSGQDDRLTPPFTQEDLLRAKERVARKKGLDISTLRDDNEFVQVEATQYAKRLTQLQSTQGRVPNARIDEFEASEVEDSDVEIDETDDTDTSTYERIWGDEVLKKAKTLVDYPFPKHPKPLPRSMEADKKEHIYRLTALVCKANVTKHNI